MKILLLVDRLPYPIKEGQDLRLFNLFREISYRHEVSLVSFGNSPYAPALTEVFRTIDTVPRGNYRLTSDWNRIFDSFLRGNGIPIVPAMVKLIRETIEKARPNIILAGGWNMVTYASTIQGVPVVADVIDERVLTNLRALRYAKGPRGVVIAVRDVVNSFRWSRHYLPRVRCCIFSSQLDARWARRVVPNLRVSVVENGVDHEFFHPIESEDSSSVIFEGNQWYPPNVDAVHYFHSAIYPRILSRFPRCRFYIVGRRPAPSVQALAGENVIVTGRVEDIRPSFGKASVFVCPMRMGAGIKNKILQAWAMAMPVVATPAAMGGLAAVPDHNIIVAKDPTRFADAVCELLSDGQRRRELGEKARETILAHHNWPQKAAVLESILEKHLV
jgi:glycosyltransferase involved in cell wall biosynthesis